MHLFFNIHVPVFSVISTPKPRRFHLVTWLTTTKMLNDAVNPTSPQVNRLPTDHLHTVESTTNTPQVDQLQSDKPIMTESTIMTNVPHVNQSMTSGSTDLLEVNVKPPPMLQPTFTLTPPPTPTESTPTKPNGIDILRMAVEQALLPEEGLSAGSAEVFKMEISLIESSPLHCGLEQTRIKT